MDKSISIQLFFEDQLFESLRSVIKDCRVFVLCDENSYHHCLPSIKKIIGDQIKNVYRIQSGENNKNLTSCTKIWTQLLKDEANRNDIFINLGGGVICDMGGFIASCFKRGMKFIHIPTTLLAMVDASIGGKLGVDHDQIKNAVGSIVQPLSIHVYPEFLQTLDSRQKVSGMAEMIKHALIFDAELLEDLSGLDWQQTAALLPVLKRAIEIKKNIVLRDPYENNIRKALNFGHTIGHALESMSWKTSSLLLHGEAVSIGIITEAFLSWKIVGLSEKELYAISKVVLSIFPKYSLEDYSVTELIKLMKNDKKNDCIGFNFTLLNKIGQFSINHNVDKMYIQEALDFYRNLNI